MINTKTQKRRAKKPRFDIRGFVEGICGAICLRPMPIMRYRFWSNINALGHDYERVSTDMKRAIERFTLTDEAYLQATKTKKKNSK